MADKKAYTVRIDTDLLDKVKAAADDRGDTVTDTIENALKSHLNISTDKPDLHNIESRLRALEAKFKGKPKPAVNLDEIGDLINIDEMEALTGYTRSTLSSKLSRENVQAVDRIDGNRGGLYSKDEVLQKIGIRK